MGAKTREKGLHQHESYLKKMHTARELLFVFKKKMQSARIQITQESILLISIKITG